MRHPLRVTCRLVLIYCFMAGVVFAQQFWDTTDFRRWSKRECVKLLENSPWAQRTDVVNAYAQTGTVEGSYHPQADRISFVVQFRSALPVRKALVQSTILAAEYDEMTRERKLQTDAKIEQFLTIRFPDEVVIHVHYGSNNPYWDDLLARFYQHSEQYEHVAPTLRAELGTLLVGHQRIQPIRSQVLPGARREFELTFPRRIDGKPLIDPGAKSVAVEIAYPDIGSLVGPARQHEVPMPTPRHPLRQALPIMRVTVPFKVKDMVRDGEVMY